MVDKKSEKIKVKGISLPFLPFEARVRDYDKKAFRNLLNNIESVIGLPLEAAHILLIHQAHHFIVRNTESRSQFLTFCQPIMNVLYQSGYIIQANSSLVLLVDLLGLALQLQPVSQIQIFISVIQQNHNLLGLLLERIPDDILEYVHQSFIETIMSFPLNSNNTGPYIQSCLGVFVSVSDISLYGSITKLLKLYARAVNPNTNKTAPSASPHNAFTLSYLVMLFTAAPMHLKNYLDYFQADFEISEIGNCILFEVISDFSRRSEEGYPIQTLFDPFLQCLDSVLKNDTESSESVEKLLRDTRDYLEVTLGVQVVVRDIVSRVNLSLDIVADTLVLTRYDSMIIAGERLEEPEESTDDRWLMEKDVLVELISTLRADQLDLVEKLMTVKEVRVELLARLMTICIEDQSASTLASLSRISKVIVESEYESDLECQLSINILKRLNVSVDRLSSYWPGKYSQLPLEDVLVLAPSTTISRKDRVYRKAHTKISRESDIDWCDATTTTDYLIRGGWTELRAWTMLTHNPWIWTMMSNADQAVLETELRRNDGFFDRLTGMMCEFWYRKGTTDGKFELEKNCVVGLIKVLGIWDWIPMYLKLTEMIITALDGKDIALVIEICRDFLRCRVRDDARASILSIWRNNIGRFEDSAISTFPKLFQHPCL